MELFNRCQQKSISEENGCSSIILDLDLASLVDGTVELLGGDPVEPSNSVLKLQVLLFVGGRGRAEEVPVKFQI